jgi:CheY-like chemotaxis protein
LALRIVQKLGSGLDLIVSDIRMPGDMDGLDMAHSIRNSFPNIPVILISSYADDEAVKQAAAIFKLIQKPFVPETILKSVKKMVGSANAKASQAANT